MNNRTANVSKRAQKGEGVPIIDRYADDWIR
jgi:hypothetical protein